MPRSGSLSNPTLKRPLYERTATTSRHTVRLGRAANPARTMTAAWTRAAGKNPKGGLNARGRASAPGNLRPPVKGRPRSPQELRRKGSFLSRMGNAKGPERKADGQPTRLLLSLRAWGAPSKEVARSRGKRLLEQYHRQKAKKKS